MLGPFDPLLLGWSSREPFIGSYEIVTVNGLFRACVPVAGRVVGIWTLNGDVLTVNPLEPLRDATVSALRKDAADVFRYLGSDLDGTVVFVS